MPYSIDQSYTTGQDNADGSGIGNLRRAANNNIILAQSFTPTILGTLPQFDFYMKKVSTPTGNIWAQIFTDAGGPGTGVQLGSDSATVDVSTVSTSYVYQSFTFSSTINISPSTKYWAYLLGDYTIAIDVGVYVGIDTSSPTYAGGNYGRYGNGGAAWEDVPTYCALFKQYYIPTAGGAFLYNFVK